MPEEHFPFRKAAARPSGTELSARITGGEDMEHGRGKKERETWRTGEGMREESREQKP